MIESELDFSVEQQKVQIVAGHKLLLKEIFPLGELVTFTEEKDVDLVRVVQGVLKTLTKTEKKTIEISFGLKDGVQRTPKQVAEERNIRVNTVYPVRTKALSKLRHPGRSRNYNPFFI